MDMKKYTKPEIKELGLAKDIIKNLLKEGTGDTFTGVQDLLASS